MKYSFVKKICTLTAVAILALSAFSTVARAQTSLTQSNNGYITLAPLPGTTDCDNQQINGVGDMAINCTSKPLNTYLPALFNLAIGIAAALAFVMISWGGFTLMTTDSIQGKTGGRKKVTEAIQGLILVLGAYAILYTINPQILTFNLNIGTPTYNNLPVFSAAQVAAIANDNSAINSTLGQASGGKVSMQTPCASGQTTGCTDVSGIQPETFNGILAFQKQSGCPVLITSGDETSSGHTPGSNHYNGTAVDVSDTQCISTAVDTYYKQTSQNPDGSCPTWTDSSGNTYLYETSGDFCGGKVASSGAPHWHITYAKSTATK